MPGWNPVSIQNAARAASAGPITTTADVAQAQNAPDAAASSSAEPSPSRSTPYSQEILVFPREFRAAPNGAQYPAICFEYVDRDRNPRDKIFFPMPPGIEISDSMSFDTIELGTLGDTLTKIVAAADKQSGLVSAAKSAGIAGWNSLKDKWAASNAAAMAQIGIANIPVANTASKYIDFGRRKVIAPNTNTTFRNSNIRSFSFKFKMVATSYADTQAIFKIVSYFRENMYPEALNGDLILAYPGTWNINFLAPAGGAIKNEWIPQVYESFLTGFSSTYNSSTNMFHDDGSPIEVDVSLSFSEVKALNKSHIQALNGNDLTARAAEIE